MFLTVHLLTLRTTDCSAMCIAQRVLVKKLADENDSKARVEFPSGKEAVVAKHNLSLPLEPCQIFRYVQMGTAKNDEGRSMLY